MFVNICKYVYKVLGSVYLCAFFVLGLHQSVYVCMLLI